MTLKKEEKITSTKQISNNYPRHLYEFLYETTVISETKVNLLKNYYYSYAKTKLNIKNWYDFRIGSSKNKELLWMQSIKEPEYHLIFHLPTETYKILIKKFPETTYKNSPMLPGQSKIKETDNLLKHNPNKTCCIIL